MNKRIRRYFFITQRNLMARKYIWQKLSIQSFWYKNQIYKEILLPMEQYDIIFKNIFIFIS